jgi:hypothetical protein
MPLGRVADEGDGATFFAHAELDEPGPFSFVNGPDEVPAEEAIGWARQHARRVIVRIGDAHYSAGEEPVEGLERWRGTPAPPLPATGAPVASRVVASTGWHGADRPEVARSLAAGVEKNQRARGVARAVDATGFEVAFTITAASLVEANEVASAIVRRAWADTGIEAVPGEDFDGDGVSVQRA